MKLCSDIDLDHNVFSSCHVTESNYYFEDGFNDLIDSTPSLGHCNFCTSSLLHPNVRSLPRNLSELNLYLKGIDLIFPIICVTEMFHPDSCIDLFEIDGYKTEHVYRKNRKEGGVTFYISDKL